MNDSLWRYYPNCVSLNILMNKGLKEGDIVTAAKNNECVTTNARYKIITIDVGSEYVKIGEMREDVVINNLYQKLYLDIWKRNFTSPIPPRHLTQKDLCLAFFAVK